MMYMHQCIEILGVLRSCASNCFNVTALNQCDALFLKYITLNHFTKYTLYRTMIITVILTSVLGLKADLHWKMTFEKYL